MRRLSKLLHEEEARSITGIINEPWIHRSIDFSQCRYYDDFYLLIKRKLELPDFCGHNLDALYDGVTGMMTLPADITVRGAGKTPAKLKDLAMSIIEVLRDAENEYGFVRVHVVD